MSQMALFIPQIISVLLILFLFKSISPEILICQTKLPTLSHGYVTEQAWALLKAENPNKYSNTEMDYFFNKPAVGEFINIPFLTGTIKAGSFIEDRKEIMYSFSYPCDIKEAFTSTHFWDADAGDNVEMHVAGICIYKNAFTKANSYWTGNVDGHPFINMVPSVFGFYNGTGYYFIKISFTTLADAFKHPENVYVVDWGYTNDKSLTHLEEPTNIIRFLQDHTVPPLDSATIKFKFKKVIWEIVGRICHLIEDQGVPAHVHNDIHGGFGFWNGGNDSYEGWLPDNFRRKTWIDALNQGGHIDINGCNYPLRTALFTLNQLTDRFPSDDEDGDLSYKCNLNTVDSGFIRMQLQPFYDKFNGYTTKSFRDDPIPPGLMDTLLNNSYVYSIRMVAGFLDFIFNQFEVGVVSKPEIASLNQSNVLCPGSYADIKCNIFKGMTPLTYNWTVSNDPSVTYQVFGDHIRIYRNGKSGEKMPSLTVTCNVSNNFGEDSKILSVFCSKNCNTCPWLFIFNENNGWVSDNNILNKSKYSENIGNEILDRYILRESPSTSDGKIKINLAEIGTDSTDINSVKLFAIDHTPGTIVGITENNEIVLFDSLETNSTDLALLRDTSNTTIEVTKSIQYNNTSESAMGDSLYHLYAHYSNDNNTQLGIIIGSQTDGTIYPIICNATDCDGVLNFKTSSDEFSSNFSKRLESSLTVIPVTIPLEDNSIAELNIDWYKPFKTRYVAITSINYNADYIMTQCPLLEALKPDLETVTPYILEKDTLSSYISPTSNIEISFASIPANSKSYTKRDYLLEINGKIVSVNGYSKGLNNPLKGNSQTRNKANTIMDNYPNPFNPTTKISYKIENPGFVSLEVFDVLGRKVNTLVSEYKKEGMYIVEFDGQNLSSGIYFYKFKSGNINIVKKMLLVK